MNDEEFLKKAKQSIIEREWDSISHKDYETPDDWCFEVQMLWYTYDPDNYKAVFQFSSISRERKYEVYCNGTKENEIEVYRYK